MPKTKTVAPVTLPNARACPKCHNPANLTLWMPPRGCDHTLREFYCRGCRETFYVPIAGDIMRARLTTLQATMQAEIDRNEQEAKTASQALPGTALTRPGQSGPHAQPGTEQSQ